MHDADWIHDVTTQSLFSLSTTAHTTVVTHLPHTPTLLTPKFTLQHSGKPKTTTITTPQQQGDYYYLAQMSEYEICEFCHGRGCESCYNECWQTQEWNNQGRSEHHWRRQHSESSSSNNGIVGRTQKDTDQETTSEAILRLFNELQAWEQDVVLESLNEIRRKRQEREEPPEDQDPSRNPWPRCDK